MVIRKQLRVSLLVKLRAVLMLQLLSLMANGKGEYLLFILAIS